MSRHSLRCSPLSSLNPHLFLSQSRSPRFLSHPQYARESVLVPGAELPQAEEGMSAAGQAIQGSPLSPIRTVTLLQTRPTPWTHMEETTGERLEDGGERELERVSG